MRRFWFVALAAVVSVGVYCIPIVRYLLWLNAAAISVEFRRPGLFLPVAAAIFILMFGVFAAAALVVNSALGSSPKNPRGAARG